MSRLRVAAAGQKTSAGKPRERMGDVIAFLTRPSAPPTQALPRLRGVSASLRPRLVVARVGQAGDAAVLAERLTIMKIAARPAEREPGDPLVAGWLAAPPDEPACVAAALLDLLLLGGGWPLLDAVLARLEALPAGASRTLRLEALGQLAGVCRADAPLPSPSSFLPGGAPFAA